MILSILTPAIGASPACNCRRPDGIADLLLFVTEALNGKQWCLLCGEITKLLNDKYEYTKGC